MDLRLDFDGDLLTGDLVREGAGLKLEEGLGTAVVLSLFSDARARPDDELPPLETDPRGWWGEAFAGRPGQVIAGDRFGSRLWLLERRKILPETLREAEEMAREALAWMIEDGVVEEIRVLAEAHRPATLALRVTLIRPDREAVAFAFQRLWDGEAARWAALPETSGEAA